MLNPGRSLLHVADLDNDSLVPFRGLAVEGNVVDFMPEVTSSTEEVNAIEKSSATSITKVLWPNIVETYAFM